MLTNGKNERVGIPITDKFGKVHYLIIPSGADNERLREKGEKIQRMLDLMLDTAAEFIALLMKHEGRTPAEVRAMFDLSSLAALYRQMANGQRVPFPGSYDGWMK